MISRGAVRLQSGAGRSGTALRAIVPNSHILLGTDSPFGPMSPTIDQLQTLGLPKAELIAIERGNALALMPGLA